MSEKILHFCTLFDSNYLTRGLALYESLRKYCPEFILYVVAFDDKCYEILSKLKLPNLIAISLKEFESPELLEVKKTRTQQEYCWTCTSSVISYTIKKYNLDMCTYVDADLLFFANPELILDEMGEKSVLLTEHRLPDNSPKSKLAGQYCVQFMPFKNNDNGMNALTWWKDKCVEWCYARIEDGKYGDQKYLDDWTDRFPGVHVMDQLGGGVAPWNMFRYKIINDNGKFFVLEKSTGRKKPLIFYHFHSTKIFSFLGKVKSTYWPYDINLDLSTKQIYNTYNSYIYSAVESVRIIELDFNLGFAKTSNYLRFTVKKSIETLKRSVKILIKSFLQ